MSNWRRLVGLVRFGVRRTAAHAAVSRQVAFAVVGVAFTVMLMTTVGGIALGLASNSAVQSEDVDLWIVPEESTAEALAVDVGGPSLGDVHAVSDRLSTDRRIDYVTPIALRIVRLSNTETGTAEYVLAVGVIPAREQSVAGLSMSALTPGDPHYANGSFDGRWTGELVASDAAAQLLDADTGTVLRSDGATNASFLVVDRQQAGLSTGAGPVPVVVVHLAELQTLSGGNRVGPGRAVPRPNRRPLGPRRHRTALPRNRRRRARRPRDAPALDVEPPAGGGGDRVPDGVYRRRPPRRDDDGAGRHRRPGVRRHARRARVLGSVALAARPRRGAHRRRPRRGGSERSSGSWGSS
ncbi:hypothetical protein [Salinigranum sp. GCM10025319]|uniref:hypothetical protein n=1 Tax=Salinigranum sp. GCM10025319 TaxID=3252687 RepID=UPI00360CBB1D